MYSISEMNARLASFIHTSLVQDPRICPSVLARVGYTYSAELERVLCSGCQFKIENLNDSIEDITKQHEEFNVGCQYIKEAKDVSSVDHLLKLKDGNFHSQFNSISDDMKISLNVSSPALIKTIESIEERAKKRAEENITKTNDSVDSGSTLTRRTRNDTGGTTAFEIQQQAKHPGLANREERVRTFRGQDYKYSRSNYPDIIPQLVDAGFYYTGPTDNVRCFFCDGGLKNFSPHDRPFDEHQKWFKDCKYVKFLAERRNRTPVLQQDAVDHGPNIVTTNLLPTNAATGLDFQRPVRVLEPREIKARLETPRILKLLDMGYQKENIRQAIERRFATKGDDFESIADLVSDMLSVQGQQILPPLSHVSEEIRVVNAITTPPIQPQMQIAAKASAASASTDDGIDGTGFDASYVLPVGFSEKDAIQMFKNNNIDDEELRNLWKVHEQYASVLTCQVCFQNQISTVFLPCGHYVCCDTCTPKLSNCCICRSLIRGTVKALTRLSQK